MMMMTTVTTKSQQTSVARMAPIIKTKQSYSPLPVALSAADGGAALQKLFVDLLQNVCAVVERKEVSSVLYGAHRAYLTKPN